MDELNDSPLGAQEWMEFLTEQLRRDKMPSYTFDEPEEIGTALREIRKRLGLSQLTVATAALGPSDGREWRPTHTNLCGYEKGRREPDTRTLMKLLALYGYRLVIEPIPPE